MKLINTEGIDPRILSAIERGQSDYGEEKQRYLKTVAGHYDIELSVTTLAQPPQIAVLKSRHYDEIEIDVIDRYAILIGSTLHNIAEENALPGDQSEVRYGRTFKLDGRLIHVHGKADVVNEEFGYIGDWKVSSMFAMRYEKDDYAQQLNLLRYLHPRREKFTRLSNIFIFRDFRASEARSGRSPEPSFQRDYPHQIWDDETCRRVLRDRIRAHLAARELPDEELPNCTNSEMWYSKEGYRVIHVTKKGELSKVSSGWAETEMEARALAERKKPGVNFTLQPTTGVPRRCPGCDVRAFCHQFKALPTSEADSVEEI